MTIEKNLANFLRSEGVYERFVYLTRNFPCHDRRGDEAITSILWAFDWGQEEMDIEWNQLDVKFYALHNRT